MNRNYNHDKNFLNKVEEKLKQYWPKYIDVVNIY